MEAMKKFLVEGQGDAQLLAAGSIATVLHNRSDLFNFSKPNEQLIEDSALHVYPLDKEPILDGYGSDWEQLISQARTYSSESLIYDRTDGSTPPVSFALVLGEQKTRIYGFIRVIDSNVVSRSQKHRKLNRSDQVRIIFKNKNGIIKRYSLLLESADEVSTYEMREDWENFVTGDPDYKLRAFWKNTNSGYDLEFRMPKDWLNDEQSFKIMVADVNSEQEREINNIVATIPNNDTNSLNKLIIRSPELDRIINGLDYAESNVCIVDKYRRPRSVPGKNTTDSKLCSLTEKVEKGLVKDALAGHSNKHQIDKHGKTIITASAPIYQGSNRNIIGVVLVEKNSTKILAKQQKTLNKIITETAIVSIFAMAIIVFFSNWLTFRIRKLQSEVSTAIDSDGRLINHAITSSKDSRDDIGELSRAFSTLLSQLKTYMSFLEDMPRTLRHEILNPINTISMTLQKMSANEHFDQKYIDIADKALRQLQLIVHSLTEAAHIDDALSEDEMEVIDIAELLTEYVSNIRHKHPEKIFTYSGPNTGVHILGSDLRISQLLDKLQDNAIDFSEENTEIKFELSANQKNQVTVNICNTSPPIPESIISSLCNTIMSHREGASNAPHLGIGLYVASHIAKHHKGSLKIFNNSNTGEVCVTTLFPLADKKLENETVK